MQIDITTAVALVLSVLLLGYLTSPCFSREILNVRQWLVAIWPVLAILLASVRPVGIYLARVLEGERTWLDPVLRPVERLIYKLCGIHADQEMNWREYAYSGWASPL